MEQTIVVSISFRMINPHVFYVEKSVYNDKMHIIKKTHENGYSVVNYMMAITHQFISKTKNVETSIRWAQDKLINVYKHVEITKTTVKYVKKYE